MRTTITTIERTIRYIVLTFKNSKLSIRRHQTPPRYRNAASHASPYGPLRPNVTSSIKPKVHKVAQRRQKRTEPRPRGSAQQILWRSAQRLQRYARGQTDTQTVRQTDRYYTPLPYRDGVMMRSVARFLCSMCTIRAHRLQIDAKCLAWQWFSENSRSFGTVTSHHGRSRSNFWVKTI